MLQLRFDQACGGLATAQSYIANLNTYFGFPRPGGTEIWFQTYVEAAPSLKAQANPLDPLAAWAVDISIESVPAGGDYENMSLAVFPIDITASVPIPSGVTQFDWDTSDPEWTVQTVGP